MSQALRTTRCSYLRLLHTTVRGCNTYMGALGSLDKTHADVIQQIEYRSVTSTRNGQPMQPATKIVLQHGHQIISAIAKRHAKQSYCRSLDTHLAPLSVIDYKEQNSLKAWKEDITFGHNSKIQETRENYVRPCTESKDDILEEKRHKICDVTKESLRTLNVQELDRLFQMAILTARKRSEIHAEVIRKLPVESFGHRMVVYFTQFFDRQAKMMHTILKEMDRIFRKQAEPSRAQGLSYTQYSSRGRSPTQAETKSDSRMKSDSSSRTNLQKGTMYFADASDGATQEKKPSERGNRPSLEQLTKAKDYFVETIPDIINKRFDYTPYTQDVVLENNYFDKPHVKRGLSQLIAQVIKLRFKVCTRYFRHGVFVKGAQMNEEEGSFCIHWEIKGTVFLFRKIFQIWRYMPWKIQTTLDKDHEEFEGLLTCYLDRGGEIYRVRIDKVVVDSYGASDKKPTLVEKLAMGGNPT